ncbi:MAG: hypothetical protein HYS18_11510 [Burkholderiales bacterium]|nr:hypothetical protein [Burkholderiales bacterium]
MDIQALIQSPEQETFLEETDWLDIADESELEAIHTDFASRFDKWLTEFAARLGQPAFTKDSDKELAADLYLEAVKIAGWKRNNGYLVLAYGQHDRETPVFVSFDYREREF